jgi:hypothetical protein
MTGIAQSSLVKGAVVGLAASQALDRISGYWYENEPIDERVKEDSARNFRHVYEVAVSQLASLFGKRLSTEQERKYGWRFHQAFGLLNGFVYVSVRKRFPRIGVGHGLLFGAAFFLLVDELMMPLFKWSPGPRKFNWKVHARGAVSHIAYGVAAESAYRMMEKRAQARP